MRALVLIVCADGEALGIIGAGAYDRCAVSGNRAQRDDIIEVCSDATGGVPCRQCGGERMIDGLRRSNRVPVQRVEISRQAIVVKYGASGLAAGQGSVCRRAQIHAELFIGFDPGIANNCHADEIGGSALRKNQRA